MSKPCVYEDERVRSNDVVVTRAFMGLLHMQVCAYGEVPPDRVQERANALNPSGTSAGWFLILEGDRAPVQCKDYPDRLHYMLEC